MTHTQGTQPLTARILAHVQGIAERDAAHGAGPNESATDIYGQVMMRPVRGDFDRMYEIYDAYRNAYYGMVTPQP